MQHERQLCVQDTLEITQKGNSHMQNILYMTQEGLSSVNVTSLTLYNAVRSTDQQMHNICVNNILSTRTCFTASASSSGSLNFLLG
jgi:hypothetical protein